MAKKKIIKKKETKQDPIPKIKKQEKEVIEEKPKQYIAKKNISKVYKQGTVISEAQVKKWQSAGINTDGWFE